MQKSETRQLETDGNMVRNSAGSVEFMGLRPNQVLPEVTLGI